MIEPRRCLRFALETPSPLAIVSERRGEDL
jgi:hypothetical protein